MNPFIRLDVISVLQEHCRKGVTDAKEAVPLVHGLVDCLAYLQWEMTKHFRVEDENPITDLDPITGIFRWAWAQHEINTQQWALEDEVRQAMADPHIAAAKRRIDISNQKRSDAMEHLDAAFQRWFTRWSIKPFEGADYSTETLGSAFDRLSVLQLRKCHTEWRLAHAKCDEDSEQSLDLISRLEVIAIQLEHLVLAIKSLLREILEGRKVFEPCRHYKLYRALQGSISNSP